ncbi:collagen-binding domain-containing protein [Pseudocnuella soli]|uniref:collagen-binding domain-containing protein n=1 Tax=Pseudocnuella soli TaxID=2502779 RepID=UPI00104635E5|nr:collagen-binding domain-containing protein [Pseudocnuella soli]
MIKTLRNLLACACAATTLAASAQTINPLAPALGFNVMTSGDVTATRGDTHGPVAIGGNLILNGQTIFTMNNSGTFPTGAENNTENFGMVIGGKIVYNNGNQSQINKGVLRIRNTEGSKLWYKDNNGANTNLKLNKDGAGFDANPSLIVQRQQAEGSATLPNGIDFGGTFEDFKDYSDWINSWNTNTTALITGVLNKVNIPGSQNPKINLVKDKINYINLTGEQLNALRDRGSIDFDNKAPAADRILVINVQAPGHFAWKTPNFAGVQESNGSYIIWNFHGTTSLTLGVDGGESTYGTLFAPLAVINKVGGNNTNGQVVAKSIDIAYGEIHYWPFKGFLPELIEETTLPLRGMELSAGLQDQKAKLTWKVLGEADMDHYIVERSTDGKNFTNAAMVFSAGNNEQFTYRFNDDLKTATAPVVYYRIKAVENGGKLYYSNHVTVRLSTPATAAVQAWPNPFKDGIAISYTAPASGTVQVRLSDASGKVVKSVVAAVSKGANQISLSELAQLAPGLYLLQLWDAANTNIATSKIMK